MGAVGPSAPPLEPSLLVVQNMSTFLASYLEKSQKPEA